MHHQDTVKQLPDIERIAGRIIAIHLAFGILWIYGTDALLSALVSDVGEFQRYSTYKGWAYIAITAAVLYLLIRLSLRHQLNIQQSLMISEERWKFALEGAGEGVWDWNIATGRVFRSARWHQIYGYREHEVGPGALDGRKLMHPDDQARAVAEINAHLAGETPLFVSEFRLKCRDGSWKWTLSRGMIVSRAPDGAPLRMIGTHTDITGRKQAEAQIYRLAHYDAVTGLPNRILFLDRFRQDILRARRQDSLVALLYLDLDRFKEVNDTLGHDSGDQLLQEAGQRLVRCVRASDTVARIGGDEFAVILNDIADAGASERVAQTILNQLAAPFQLGDEMVYISTSIGISLYPADGDDVEPLIKHADQAMYAAKSRGRNTYHYFTPAMQESTQARLRTARELRTALADGQFAVHYQPIVELASGRIAKAEALVRWQHPARGLVSPAEFIPIAEDTGLIVELGDYVFAQAAAMSARWRALHADFQVSVNTSPVQFRNRRGQHLDWQRQLESLALPGDALAIEITEGLLFEANSAEIRQLASLREAGMQVAIDDFGTGYSSLAYLSKFDIDYVKIDRSFTRNLSAGSDELALCEAIIVMTHKLGLKVIAEGVETAEQRDLLCAAGCDYAQGFLYAQAVPADAFEQLLAATPPLAAHPAALAPA